MHQRILTGSLFVLLALFGTVALSKEKGKEKPLAPADSPVDRLIGELGDQDFQVRRQAEEKLVKLGDKAVPALNKAARESSDPHVRLEAQRILSRLGDRTARAPGRRLEGIDQRLRRLDRSMDELLKEMESRGILDEKALERLRDLVERGPSIAPGGTLHFGTDLDHAGVMHGMVDTGDQKIEYERDADGHVKVTVTKNGDTETYRADSLDALKDSNPDVYDLVRKHFEGGMIGIGRFPALPVPQPLHRLDLPPTGRPPLPAAGFRLGVWVGEMSDALRYHLDLGEGQGLLVESVVEGSLAEKIGVRHFDVIVKVNGTPVGSAADVAKALADVPEGGQVKVEVIRQGKPLDLVGTR